MGVMLPFEHVLLDAGADIEPPVEAYARHIFFSPIDAQALSHVRYYGYANQETLRIGSIETMTEEILHFKEWGGGTIVDCTSVRLGRDPSGLARLARRTGIDLVMSTSCESAVAPGGEVEDCTEVLVATMVNEITNGDRGHGIRAGLIVYDEARMVGARLQDAGTTLRACVAAHKMTGAPLLVRPTLDEDRIRQTIDALAELDVAPERVTIGRAGGRTREELKLAAEAGFLLSFDSFGSFGALDRAQARVPSGNPVQRAVTADDEGDPGLKVILELIGDGYEGQVLLSHGIGRGDRLAMHGGHGYFYVLACVVPALKANGIRSETVDRLISQNPQKALSFYGRQ